MKENYFQQGILPRSVWIFDLTLSQTGSASLIQSALALFHQRVHKMMCMPTIHHFHCIFYQWKRFSACLLSTEGLACVQVLFPVRKQENVWSHEQVGVTSCFDLEIITMRAIESNVWWRLSFTPTEDSCRLTQASFSLATLLVLNFAGLLISCFSQ